MSNHDVEWRKGSDGLGGTYTFSNPKPSTIALPGKVQKIVEFKIPLLDGSLVQELNNDSRTLTVQGFLYSKTGTYDDLDQKRRSLESGIGTGEGQFHIISNEGQANSKHIYYKGIPQSIQYPAGRNNPHLMEYNINILCADPTEYIV